MNCFFSWQVFTVFKLELYLQQPHFTRCIIWRGAVGYVYFWSWLLECSYSSHTFVWHLWIQCLCLAFDKVQGDWSEVVSVLRPESLLKILIWWKPWLASNWYFPPSQGISLFHCGFLSYPGSNKRLPSCEWRPQTVKFAVFEILDLLWSHNGFQLVNISKVVLSLNSRFRSRMHNKKCRM